MRSKEFQRPIGGKGITSLLGQELGGVVFEGFTDYFSALTHFGQISFEQTVLLLNSVGMLTEAHPTLPKARLVRWVSHHHLAGERALWLLRQSLTPELITYQNLGRAFMLFHSQGVRRQRLVVGNLHLVYSSRQRAKWQLYA